MTASLPKAFEAIKSRVDILSQAKKLPKGMDAAKLTEAKDGLAAGTKALDEATAAFKAGNVTEAIQKAGGLKDKAASIMALLGMQPAAAPAAAAPAAPAAKPAK